MIRDDSQVSGYIRMEQTSGLIGIYEKANAATVWDDGTPWESENELFEPDYDRIMPWLENALERMPVLADKGIKSVVHGAITHPPDGNMLLGPSGLKNFWCCCGSQGGTRKWTIPSEPIEAPSMRCGPRSRRGFGRTERRAGTRSSEISRSAISSPDQMRDHPLEPRLAYPQRPL